MSKILKPADWKQYPNFTQAEFRCRITGLCFMEAAFLDKLQAIRNEFGRPMPVTSGYRDPSHPAEQGKSVSGAHTLGIAADIGVHGAAALELVEIALRHGIQRIGLHQRGPYNQRFVHLDLGGARLPAPAIWTY